MDSRGPAARGRLASVRRRALVVGLLASASAVPASAARQPGKDGALTVALAGTVVNPSARLAASAPAGSTTLTLGAVAGSCTLAPASLQVNDLLLVIQMQGATMSTVDAAAYGDVTSLNNAGRFEFVSVQSVVGNVVTIDEAGLAWSYDLAGNAQVVRVPQYSSLTVNAGASIVPPFWDGQCGGVVAIDVLGAATVNGSIDVTARGFRGGALDGASLPAGVDIPTYRTTVADEGAEKGEGIAGSVATYDLLGGRYGRGAPANGGGGGNVHNSGGGGGANASNGLAWNGQGNPDLSQPGWVTAWNLDPTFPSFAVPGSTITSSGGGRGGYTLSRFDEDATVIPPGDPAWGGDDRRERGGLGGRPLLNDPSTGRLFMGGGGGAGEQNNGDGGPGGRGGGVLLLYAGSVGGGGSLLADGGVGGNSTGQNSDGAGGGGGGGAIVVQAATVSVATIRANGGSGGNHLDPSNPAGSRGPGGGGGGGYVRIRAGSLSATPSAAGGANGTSASPTLSEFPPNGATRGAAGVTLVLPTRVSLQSFMATGADGAVDLVWRTGSEVDNLGFHVHRSESEAGPWTRLTASLIPGQGFSAVGAVYAWRDGGLQNGVRYFYRLEDVDAKAGSTFHGPVSAVPLAGAIAPPPGGEGGAGGEAGAGGADVSSSCPAWALAQLEDSSSWHGCETYGEPLRTRFEVLSRTPGSVVVELTTGGFVAVRDAKGRVRALVPGFETLSGPRDPALPLKRALLDGVVTRRGRIRQVTAHDVEGYPGLVPAAVGYPQAVVRADGTVRPGRRTAVLRAFARGMWPREPATLVREGFQGERKTLLLEMAPLRYDAGRGGLVLSRRLVVRIDFREHEGRDRGHGRLGRRPRWRRPSGETYAFLGTVARGLHAVRFEDAFPGRSRGIDPATLRLTRDRGQTAVAFHVEPAGRPFGPGSRLFFHADAAPGSMSFSPEVVYALERGTGGLRMGVESALPDGSPLVGSRGVGEWETNRLFIPDVLEARDLWQWEVLLGGASRTVPFELDGLDAAAAEPARLSVDLQGASDAAGFVDHHVVVSVNGTTVVETRFDGAVPWTVEADLPVSLLRVGANEVRVVNAPDAGVPSRVFLDRFAVHYPQAGAARAGAFRGIFSSAGTAEVPGLSAPAALVDPSRSRWLIGEASGGSVRFRAEAGREYLAVSEEALRAPRVFFPEGQARLRSTRNRADYILVAPRAYLTAAEPLLRLRRSQGLATFAASLEEVASAFGGGEPSAEAIRAFLSFAYDSWQAPSPRYVLLLGDASHDPRGYLATSRPAPMPFLLEKTSYLWTVSDPALGAVNGEDPLPDLAVGRLPAATLEQAEALVAKVLDWEAQGFTLDGAVALVADNPDPAGDFEANQRDIEASFLQGRETKRIFLGEIRDADATRARILDAMDQGLGLISFAGHGGGATWASEIVLSSSDPARLLAQPRQPLMLTLNCLNGFFIAPPYESLAEAFLKVEGRGTIGAFSPSGLSLDGPAHLLHRALMAEITGGRHERLGDAILAAQEAYAGTGAMPELLSIYQLLADPALKIR